MAWMASASGPMKVMPGLGQRLLELLLLRQEAVARMNRLRAGLLAGRHDLVDQQVGLRRGRRADQHLLVGLAHVQRVGVGLGIDRHRLDAEPLAGADDAAGDLAAVGDQDLVEGRLGRPAPRPWPRALPRLSPPPFSQPSSWRPYSRSFFIAVEQALGPGGMAGDQRQPGRQHPQPPRIAAAEERVDGDQHQQERTRPRSDAGAPHGRAACALPATGSQRPSSQRNVAMLAPRILELLGLERRQRPADPPARAVRHDHVVDEAAIGGDERDWRTSRDIPRCAWRSWRHRRCRSGR